MQNLGVTISIGGKTVCRAKHWRSPGEWNNSAKIYRPVSGEGWVKMGGEVTRLKAGQLYLIPPHARMSYGTPSQMVVEWLHFRLQSALLDIRLGSILKVHPFSKAVTARWIPVCRLIERFMRERSMPDAFRINAMLMELVGVVLAGLSPESSQAGVARERLAQALQFLDSHAIQHPSLRDIARTVNLSGEHFHRLFQATFHTTPHQYALAQRMTRARDLLAEGMLSVTEVAEQCGYEDAFYFSRVFRRHFGASPGRVRRGLVILDPEP